MQHFSRKMIDSSLTYVMLENIYEMETTDKVLAVFTSGLEELNFLKF